MRLRHRGGGLLQAPAPHRSIATRALRLPARRCVRYRRALPLPRLRCAAPLAARAGVRSTRECQSWRVSFNANLRLWEITLIGGGFGECRAVTLPICPNASKLIHWFG